MSKVITFTATVYYDMEVDIDTDAEEVSIEELEELDKEIAAGLKDFKSRLRRTGLEYGVEEGYAFDLQRFAFQDRKRYAGKAGKPSTRIDDEIKRLRIKGDIGTANAIEDAVEFLKRARKMLADSIKEYNETEYRAEEEAAQARIDVLMELFEG